jgi:hypothetical protein
MDERRWKMAGEVVDRSASVKVATIFLKEYGQLTRIQSGGLTPGG